MAVPIAASTISAPSLVGRRLSTRTSSFSSCTGAQTFSRYYVTAPVAGKIRKPVEERFRIYHEKNVSEERLKDLRVYRWSKWECGPKCSFHFEWPVDEQIYITKGSLEVTPEGCEDSAFFYAGDLVRFPKWFSAELAFEEHYEHSYRFLAYGDDSA